MLLLWGYFQSNSSVGNGRRRWRCRGRITTTTINIVWYWTISTILVGDWIFIYLTINSNILIKFSLPLSFSRSLSLTVCYFSQLWPCCVVMSCGVDDGDSVGDGDYDDIVGPSMLVHCWLNCFGPADVVSVNVIQCRWWLVMVVSGLVSLFYVPLSFHWTINLYF